MNRIRSIPGIGEVFHYVFGVVEEEQDADGPQVEHTNDEGEVDEIEVPQEAWLARSVHGREIWTKAGADYSVEILMDMTKSQYDLFA